MVNRHPARSAGPEGPSGAEGPLFHRDEGSQSASRPTDGSRVTSLLPQALCWPPSNDRVPAHTEEPFRPAKGSLAPQGAISRGWLRIRLWKHRDQAG